MTKVLKIGLFLGFVSAFVCSADSFAARKNSAGKQSALQSGTKVRTKMEAKDVYDQQCYEQYYGCMDQFCIADNENGGSCTCSDDAAKYDEQLEAIKHTLAEAERIKIEEVEKVQAGANADIIFNGGERVYDKDGSVVKVGAKKEDNKKVSWSSIYNEDDEDDEEVWSDDEAAGKTGDALYKVADKLCKEQMDDSCSKDLKILTQMYSRQIVSDCKGLANSIQQKKAEADTALSEAKAAVRGALKESLTESNQDDRGTCMVKFKKCMQTEDACGSDWSNCVFTIASENMQNNQAKSTVGTKVKTVNNYDITASTMEILESKRFICEKVLDKCMAVRDYIWNDFLREAAPTIRLAEQNVESNKRQSCLSDISKCIQKACKDDIVGKGTATMDACLARPDMARSFCKIQIDPCERMEPQIWDYVVSKLAAMRVDACTAEVKECFTSEDRCGPDFMNCIGMDYKYIHDICPIDKLVVCKKANPKFAMSDLDSMLAGLWLNIDNKALENCQKIAEQKMTDLCGSTTDCNSFAANDYLGIGSIKSEKEGAIYRVTGLITFGSIKVGDAGGTVKDNGKVLAPGEIGVADYIQHLKKNNYDFDDADVIISSIENELNNIAGNINRTISLIETDQKVQYCINGRDLSQINGRASKNNTTAARFPNLLNQYRVEIAMAALRKAEDNYNKKLNEITAEATKEASVDKAQVMCLMLPSNHSVGAAEKVKTPLTVPYAISYNISLGVSDDELKALSDYATSTDKYKDGKFKSGSEVASILGTSLLLPMSMPTSMDIPGGTKTVKTTFNRETRICHKCTEMVTKECKTKGFSFGVLDTRKAECGPENRTEECEDIPM